MDERSVSSSSYFTRALPSCRLLVRVYSAEGLQHVSSHGTYCKLYVGRTEMVGGSGTFARRPHNMTASTSSHSLGGLLQSSFGSTRRLRHNTSRLPTTPVPPPPLLSSSSSNGASIDTKQRTMRVLKTHVQKGKRSDPVWNEKFEIPVADLNEDLLSIRVKSARLMSSPAIGACSLSLKHLTGLGNATIDRWVDLRRGKKDAGRLRLQLRLVEPLLAALQDRDGTVRARNEHTSDTHLSLPAEETFEDIAKRMRKKLSRRDHKYHRSARRFDGRPVSSTVLGSSCGSNRSASDKDEDQRRVAPTRKNSVSATSNESIDDSEPASDVSASPVVSPRPDRASKEDGLALANAKHTASRRPAGNPIPPVAVAAKRLDASHAHRGMMRRSELEHSKMKMTEMSRVSRSSRAPKQQVPQEDDDDDDDDDEFNDEYDDGDKSIDCWTDNHTELSVLSSILDPRESSRMDFDDDDYDEFDDEWDSLDKRDKSVKNGPASYAFSSTASSTLDPRESSRFSISDSEIDDDEVKSEKAREQQRQQWQMEQRKMQLAGIKEVSQSMPDDGSDEDLEDEDLEDDYDDGFVLNLPRMHFSPTIATLLNRESMNVLIEEEDDEEEEEEEEEEEDLKFHKMSDDFVPMLEASSPMSVDSVDCALRRSSFD